MKNILLLISVFLIQNCYGQYINPDCLIQIAAQTINQQELGEEPIARKACISEKDYLQLFYVNDIINNQPITEGKSYGIYVFGRLGDDIVSSGTLLCDFTGYKLLPNTFNYESLELLLHFFERNNLSAEESIKYLVAICKFEKSENNIGFQLED